MIGMHGTVSAAWAAERCDLLVLSALASPIALRPTPSRFLHRRRRLSTLTLTTRRSIRTSALTMPLFPMRRPPSKRLCRISRRQKHDAWRAQITEWHEKARPMCRRTMRALSIRTSCSARLRRRPSSQTDGSTSFGARSTTAPSTFRQFLTSGGLGTMGFWLRRGSRRTGGLPDRTVVHITGDGSFHMNLNGSAPRFPITRR